MKELDEYYIKNLYPFQDGILNILKELKLPFYLTGGTPLSRFYFSHRYSDDLDLFVNNDNNFDDEIGLIFKTLDERQVDDNFIIDRQNIVKSNNFMQILISKDMTQLKIDFVNDVASHFGEFITDKRLGKIDSLRNILSNKFSALFRFEVKDVVDIWVICKHFKCDFREIIEEAKSKEAGVDPVAIFEILTTFPLEKLDLIKWIDKPDPDIFKKDITLIADDILIGRENTLCVCN